MERRDYLKTLGLLGGGGALAGGITIQIQQPTRSETVEPANSTLTTTHTPTQTTASSTTTRSPSSSTMTTESGVGALENTTTTTTTTTATPTTTTTTRTPTPTSTTTTTESVDTQDTNNTTTTTTTTTTTPHPRSKYVITRGDELVYSSRNDEWTTVRYWFKSQNRSQWYVDVALQLELDMSDGTTHTWERTNDLSPGEEWDAEWNKTDWMNQQDQPVAEWWIQVKSVEIVR